MPDKGPFYAPLLPGMRQRFGAVGRFAPPGTLVDAKNVRFRNGRVERREGTAVIGTPPSANQANWIADGFAGFDDKIYAYGDGVWNLAGSDTPFTPDRRYGAIFSEDDSVFWPTIAQFGDTVLVAASTEQTASLTSSVVVRAFTRDGVIKDQIVVSTACEPRLLVSEDQTTCFLLYIDAVAQLRIVTITEALVTSAATLIGGLGTTVYDACVIVGQSPDAIAVAYDAGANIAMARVSNALAITHTATIASASTAAVALVSASSRVNVTMVNSTGVQWFARNAADLTSVVATTTLQAGSATVIHSIQGGLTIYARGTTTFVAATRQDLGTTPTSETFDIECFQVSAAGAVVTSSFTPDFLVGSKWFPTTAVNGTDIFLIGRARCGRQAILKFHADGSALLQGQIVGTIFDRDSVEGDALQTDVALDVDASTYPRRLYTAFTWRPRSGLRACDVYQCHQRGDMLASGAGASSGRWRQVLKQWQGTYIAGGACLVEPHAPGLGTPEATANAEGFLAIPTAYAVATAGAGLTAATVYSYVVTLEHVNERGERVQSEPSAPVTASPSGGNLAATLRIQTIGGTYRQDTVFHVWRSWNGGPYYRVTPDSGAPLNTSNFGACGFRSLTYVDTMTDASAEEKERLYTDSGELPNASMTGGRIACQGGGRLFAVDNLDRIRFTKLPYPNEPAQFVDDPSFMILPTWRPTGLAYLDGVLVIFSAEGIELVSGEGPDDTGNGTFSEPRALPVDAGCGDPRSVVVCSAGVAYRTPGGRFMLLPRGFGAPVWIGEDAQLLERTYPSTHGAARAAGPYGELLHWLVAPSEAAVYTPGGYVLAFDVVQGAWSYDDLRPFAGGSDYSALNGIGSWTDATLAFVTQATSGARQLSLAAAADVGFGGTRQIDWTVRIAQLRPFGLIGRGEFAEVVLAGEALGDGTVTIVTATDEGVDPSETTEVHAWTLPADVTSLSAGDPLYLYPTPAKTHGTALGVTITVAPTAPASPVAAWYAVGIDARDAGGLRVASDGECK